MEMNKRLFDGRCGDVSKPISSRYLGKPHYLVCKNYR
jgi:hypothetical protein